MDFVEIIVGTTGAIFAFILPFNGIASLGTVEAGWTGTMHLVGVPLELAKVSGFVMHGLVLAVGLGLSIFAFSYLLIRGKKQ